MKKIEIEYALSKTYQTMSLTQVATEKKGKILLGATLRRMKTCSAKNKE